ncbi:MAG TPA: EAL domain-containing protein [Sulfuricurvum sp.]|nr:EAL domain-containing protein [Sulfuricurvum sp.]
MIHVVPLVLNKMSGSYVLISLFPLLSIEDYSHDAQLLDVAVEMIDEAVVITDATNKIIRVNGAFQKLTGYSMHELQDKTPSFLSSGVTSAKTYQEMWLRLLSDGQWSGEVWDRRKDGDTYPKWLSITAIKNNEGVIVNYIGVFTDISKEKETEKIIDTMAYYDALTQLPNRHYINEQLTLMVSSAELSHQKSALLLVDMDRFKLINDSLGHTAGDRLIMQVAQRIHSTVRKNDIVARLGGDEFLVVLPVVESVSDTIEVAEKILEALALPCLIDETQLYTSASIGISFFPSDGETVDAVIQHAEQAMYAAKKKGGKCYELFNPLLNETTMRRMMIENDLQRAIANGEFNLVFQPQVDPMNGKILGVEALIRWNHPEKGFISPVEFIPIAEETGFILELGVWVMREAMGTLKRWLDAGFEPIRMAINVSARQFAHPDFVGVVKQTIQACQVPAHLIELEVTESAVMEEPHRAIQICEELQQHGIEFAIDDFGTGYSSLAYLKLFPVKRLKIDKTFIDDIGKDSQSSTLAEVIIILGNSLKLEVVAEGVENLEQLAFLRERGCDLIQGFYYSAPKDEETIVSYFINGPFETINSSYCNLQTDQEK